MLSASPCFLPALTQASIHLVWKERETWRSWGKVTFPFEIISSHVSLFTSWPICSEPFSLQDEICFSLESGDLLYNTKVTRIVPMETSTKEVNSSCSCHSYKGKRGALWADMAIYFTLKHSWMLKDSVVNLKPAWKIFLKRIFKFLNILKTIFKNILTQCTHHCL